MDTLAKALKGKGNIYGSMAENITSRLPDVRKEGIKECLGGFLHEEHRLEEVDMVRGITFINDSKATNVNAAWFALESMNRPVIWIAGGQDKGNDYRALAEVVSLKVKALVCLGADNRRLTDFFEDRVQAVFEAETMEEAVRTAYMAGAPNDIVLLSPACASFDRFNDYADRGSLFKKAVYDL